MGRILIIGGAASTLTFRRGLTGAEAGHEIYWYTARPDNLVDVPSNRIILMPSGRYPRWRNVYRLLDPIHLAWITRRFHIDLIHVHYASQFLLPLGMCSRIPVVVTTMGGDILVDQEFNGVWRPYLIRLMLNRATVITAKSAFIGAAISRINPAWEDKIERIIWGVNTEIFRPGLPTDHLRKKYDIPDNAIVFFDLRLAQSFYNKHLILRAFAQLDPSLNAALLVSEYLGRKDYIHRLHELAQSLSIAHRVHFVGGIDHADMPAYLALATAIISIPVSDGMPQSLYEAMACGAYPIMGDLPQYAEILKNDQNSSLIPLGDEEATVTELRDTMYRVATDSEMRNRVCQANRAYIVKNADQSSQSTQVNAIYSRLMSSRR